MENILRRLLFGDDTPNTPTGGENSDSAPHPVADLIFREQYGLAHPGSNSKEAADDVEGFVRAVVSKLFGDTVPTKCNPAELDPMKQVDAVIARIFDSSQARQ